MALDPIHSILLVILGAVLGIVYSLRRLFRVEKAILNLEKKMLGIKKVVKPAVKKALKKKKKK